MEEFLPYKKLWIAVIVQAFFDLNSSKQKRRKDATEWIFAKKPQGEGGFRWICTNIGIEDIEALQAASMSKISIKKVIDSRNI